MTKKFVFMTASTCALLIAACGNGNGGSTRTVTATTTVTASAAAPGGSASSDDKAGAASDFVTSSNGLTIRLTKMAKTAKDSCPTQATDDAEIAAEQKTSTCVLTQVTLTNPTSSPVQINSPISSDETYGYDSTLLAGPDQYEIESENYDGAAGRPTVPRRLVPGSSCIIGEYFRVPNGKLDALALEFALILGDVSDRFEHTFTDAQTLLR